jgi:hypothetical protein
MKHFDTSQRKAPRLALRIPIVYRAAEQFAPALVDRRGHSKLPTWRFGVNAPIFIDPDGDVIADPRRPLAGELDRSDGPTLFLVRPAQVRARHAASGPTLDDLADEVEAVDAV